MKGFGKNAKNKKRLAAVLLGTLTCVSIFGGADVKEPTTVNLWIDGVHLSCGTRSSTVGDFFATREISLSANDIVNCGLDAAVTDNMDISIQRAKLVTIDDEGTRTTVVTNLATVGDVIAEVCGEGGIYDAAEPTLDTALTDGMVITIERAVKVKLINEDGTSEHYTRCETVGDFLEEIGETLTAFDTLSCAEDTLIAEGMTIKITKNRPAAMSPLDFDIDLSGAKVITCTATAYTAAADETWPYTNGFTATGVKCEVGVVAVDPSVIPLKSKLYIESEDGSFVYGYCTAEDTGGAIKGNRVDLAMNTKTECFSFGRRTVKVYVLS